MPTARLDRAVLAVTGPDARPFLHNLLTQDVVTLGVGELRYGALLTPQGRLLHDLFLWGEEGCVRLDVAASARDDLLRRLTLYRLRAKVQLTPTNDEVYAKWSATSSDPPPPGEVARSGGGGFTPAERLEATSPAEGASHPSASVKPPPALRATSPEGGGSTQGGSWSPDPRTPLLGVRTLAPATPDGAPDAYDAHRVALGVPDAALDGLTDRAYPIEADLDLLHVIDFKKGCFVGQETTSRMHRRGVVKTRLLPLVIDGATAGAEVLAGELRAGEVTYARPDRALALLRLDRIAGAALTVDGRPARVDPPPWFPQLPAT